MAISHWKNRSKQDKLLTIKEIIFHRIKGIALKGLDATEFRSGCAAPFPQICRLRYLVECQFQSILWKNDNTQKIIDFFLGPYVLLTTHANTGI